jgi:hypothetical protein
MDFLKAEIERKKRQLEEAKLVGPRKYITVTYLEPVGNPKTQRYYLVTLLKLISIVFKIRIMTGIISVQKIT